MKQKLFHFSVLKFVPSIARDEAANLGVIVVDDQIPAVRGLFLADVRPKMAALAPGYNLAALADAVRRIEQRASDDFEPPPGFTGDARIRSTEHLRTLAGVMRNQLQLSEPREYQASSLDSAARELFDLLVQPLTGRVDEPPVYASRR